MDSRRSREDSRRSERDPRKQNGRRSARFSQPDRDQAAAFFFLVSFTGAAAASGFAFFAALAGFSAGSSSAASCFGRSTSSTYAIGALSPGRKPQRRIRR